LVFLSILPHFKVGLEVPTNFPKKTKAKGFPIPKFLLLRNVFHENFVSTLHRAFYLPPFCLLKNFRDYYNLLFQEVNFKLLLTGGALFSLFFGGGNFFWAKNPQEGRGFGIVVGNKFFLGKKLLTGQAIWVFFITCVGRV